MPVVRSFSGDGKIQVLFYTFGTRGDVQPYVACGAALKKGGVKSVICTGQGFDDLIETHGLAAKPVSIDYRDLLNQPEIRQSFDSFSGKIRAWNAMKHMFRRQFDEMLDVAREVRPQLIVTHPKAFAASFIARSIGVPHLPTTLQPNFAPTAEFPHFLFPSLGRWGNRFTYRLFNRLMIFGQAQSMRGWEKDLLGDKSAGVAPFYDGYHPDGRTMPQLHAYSRHLVPKPADWPAREHITGYWFLPPEDGWTPPNALAKFLADGPPPIYVGFGSIPAKDAEKQTAIVIEALHQLNLRGILASGWGGLAESGTPSNVHFLEDAPHDWLLPRCAAVVHHGGSGTTHEGLRWGRPTVICPLGVDQPFWGERVARLGAGSAPIPLKKLTAVKLAAAIAKALEPDMRASAESLGRQIRAENGAEKAARTIYNLLNSPPPVVEQQDV